MHFVMTASGMSHVVPRSFYLMYPNFDIVDMIITLVFGKKPS